MENYSAADESIFLIVAEPDSYLTELAFEFLTKNSLNPKLITLDSDFFLNYQKLAESQKNIYKIILIYGFQPTFLELNKQVFEFLTSIRVAQNTETPIILISTVSTSFEILDDSNNEYQQFINKQVDFLSSFVSKFPKSMIFLGQDILSLGKKINYPLLLFFIAVKMGYVFSTEQGFYFQDEKSFFALIKEYLIKPYQANKFLVRGAKITSVKLSQKIIYLYEQYFQKKLTEVKLVTNEKKLDLTREFSLVKNSRNKIENLLDQKIRGLADADSNLPSPSEEELTKILTNNKLRQKQDSQKKLAQNRLNKKQAHLHLQQSNQAQKEPIKQPERKDFSFEFIGKIEQLFSLQRHHEKQTRQEKNLVQGKTIIQKAYKRKVLFWLGTIVFSLSLIILSCFALFTLSQKTLQKQIYVVVSNDFDIDLDKKIDKSINYRFFSWQLKQYIKLFSSNSLSEALDLQELSEIVIKLNDSTAKIKTMTFDLYKKTLEGGAEISYFYEQLLSELNHEAEAQKTFNAYLTNLNFDLYPDEERQVWQNSLEKTKNSLKINFQLQKFLSSFKELVFQTGKTNVLLVLQDSHELRATGGVLTEAVLLGFDNASLVDKQVFDLDDLSTRVYGQKIISQDVKSLLGEKNALLNDSNWQADFAQSGQQITWLVEQGANAQIDLLLVLNSKAVQKILQVLGELKINETDVITAENYLEQQERFVAANSQGSFFRQLTEALVERLMHLSQTELMMIGGVFVEQLNQKELFLQTKNQALQQTIEINAWSGERGELACPAEFKQHNCFLDSFFQVESNVGVNQINPYISESIEHSLGISEQFVRHKRKIIFVNNAKTDAWPLGAYRNYLRFYLNSQASLEKIEINNRLVDLDKIKIVDAQKGRELSMLVEIPKQSTVELIITYLVPNQMSAPFSYAFFDQKQAGVFNKKTDYKIVFDEQFKPQLIAPQAKYQNKVIHFTNNNTDHFLFAVSFDR